jgi:hypothetical protein
MGTELAGGRAAVVVLLVQVRVTRRGPSGERELVIWGRGRGTWSVRLFHAPGPPCEGDGDGSVPVGGFCRLG